MTRLPTRGLYAVTDTSLTDDRGLLACVEQALHGGAAAIQYRDKTADPATALSRAHALLSLCRGYGVPLIVNDDVALAAKVGADGVHVGREDAAVRDARAALGPAAIIGASCYHDLALAQQAVADGASYVAFGRFFTSRTKPGQALATPELLQQARAHLPVSVVAIGGITAANGASLVAAGAHMLAVIHDLWSGEDCAARARALCRCFGPAPGGDLYTSR
jgi:thiamine-phosphate pyrophosphorylase